MSPPDTTARPAEATNRRLARTINLGLDLGAPEEAGWTIDVGDEHLERCAQAGSSAVRLGSCFGLHASPPTPTSCTLERLERLERVIVAASERGLAARRQASTRSEEPDDRPSACDQRNHALAPPQNNSTDGKATEQAPLEAAPVGRVGTGQTRIVTITELHTLRSHGGLVPALPSSILEPLWVQVSALLPTRQVHHPLGCYRQRVPDRIVFDKLIQLLVFGCGYRRIADATCSATTLRRRRDERITAGVAEHLRLAVLAAYDRMLGLDLEHLAVDGCITKAPCGGQTAGRSPVDRGKQGLKRSMVTEAGGIPLGAIPAAANRRDDGLLAATMDTIIAVGAPPAQPTVHLDAGYDYQSCREVLAERGMVGQIATRGVSAPVQAGRRWVIERTHAWGNQYGKLRWCTERRRLVVEFWLALASAAMVCGRLLRRAWTHYRWEDRPRRRP